MKLDNGSWVVVADGERFLLLSNQGDNEFIDLRLITSDDIDNPPAREQATGRPGRLYDFGPQKSAVDQTDWHRLEKQRFAAGLAEKLLKWSSQQRFRQLVVIADPRTLGALRAAWSTRLNSVLAAEIAKDLTHSPIEQIERFLRDHEA